MESTPEFYWTQVLFFVTQMITNLVIDEQGSAFYQKNFAAKFSKWCTLEPTIYCSA